MSDTKWRLSGGLGEPEEAAQVLTQGLGFPLRPVDGVPPQDSGELLEGIDVAEGLFMQWMGPYQAGLLYPTGSVVLDGAWTMISNVPTVTKPAPQPVGVPTWSLPPLTDAGSGTPAFVTQGDLSVVYSGHTYTFTKSGILTRLRVWVPELLVTENYRIIITDRTDPNYLVDIVIEEPVLTANAWQVIKHSRTLVSAGTILEVKLDSLNSSADTVYSGGWQCGGVVNTGAPSLGGWNRNTQNSLIRISKTDLDGTDRATELQGITTASTIRFLQTVDPNKSLTFTVTGQQLDEVDHYSYVVVLTTSGPSGAPATGETTTMTATVPTPQTTKYSEVAGSVPTPTWATVEGFLQFNSEDQGGEANSYGVDLEFDEAVINTAWDIMSFAGV
jgi:hypothetical protein